MSECADLRARIEGREVIILDGAIGTRFQRMAVPMSHDAWAAIALETHPFPVRRLHADDSRAPASTAEAPCIAPGTG